MTSAFFRFYAEFCRLCNNALVSESRSHPKARLWSRPTRRRFLTRFGQNSQLSLTLAPLGLSGVAIAQSVRLYIVASGKRFAQTLRAFKPGYDEQARFRAIPETSGSTANWYFEFQDGKMDVRTGKGAGFAGFHSQSGKSNVFWQNRPFRELVDVADAVSAFAFRSVGISSRGS